MNDLLAVGLLVVSWLCLFVAWCGSRRWLTFLGVGLAASCSPIPQQDPVVKNHHKPVNVSDINNGSGSSDPCCFAAGMCCSPPRELAYFAAQTQVNSTATWSVYYWDKHKPSEVKLVKELPGQPTALTVHQGAYPIAAVGTELLRWNGNNFTAIPAGNLSRIHALASTAPGANQRAFALVTILGATKLTVMEVTATAAVKVLETSDASTDGRSLHAIGIGKDDKDAVEIAFVAEATGSQLFLGNHPNRSLVAVTVTSPKILTNFETGFAVAHAHGTGMAISRFLAGAPAPLTFYEKSAPPPVGTPPTYNQITTPAAAIYGAAAWDGTLWVLARHGSTTGLYSLAGAQLQWQCAVDDAECAKAPGARSLIPLGAHLGLMTGDNTCWNLDKNGSHHQAGGSLPDEVDPTAMVSSLWACNQQALFAAKCIRHVASGDGTPAVLPLGIELARWW